MIRPHPARSSGSGSPLPSLGAARARRVPRRKKRDKTEGLGVRAKSMLHTSIQQRQIIIVFRAAKYMQTKLNPGNTTFFDEGVEQFRTGNLAGAIASFDRALQFDSDNADTYGYRCVARHRVGDLAGAIADCQHASNLYLVQGNDRQYQYAIEILDKLQDLSIPAA